MPPRGLFFSVVRLPTDAYYHAYMTSLIIDIAPVMLCIRILKDLRKKPKYITSDELFVVVRYTRGPPYCCKYVYLFNAVTKTNRRKQNILAKLSDPPYLKYSKPKSTKQSIP